MTVDVPTIRQARLSRTADLGAGPRDSTAGIVGAGRTPIERRCVDDDRCVTSVPVIFQEPASRPVWSYWCDRVSAAASWVTIPAVAVCCSACSIAMASSTCVESSGFNVSRRRFTRVLRARHRRLLGIGDGAGQSLGQGPADREVQVLEIVHLCCRRSRLEGCLLDLVHGRGPFIR